MPDIPWQLLADPTGRQQYQHHALLMSDCPYNNKAALLLLKLSSKAGREANKTAPLPEAEPHQHHPYLYTVTLQTVDLFQPYPEAFNIQLVENQKIL